MNRVIKTAKSQIGYLEKATNAQLDSLTANAGSNNYTKYARDLDRLGIYNGAKNGYPWCDVFVDWCFIETYGRETALKMTYQPRSGGLGAGVKHSAAYYKSAGAYGQTPHAGDQIFFNGANGAAYAHTGIVTAVDDKYVYTVEGNTSSASGVVANGGAVAAKKYARSYKLIAGYGTPNYSLVQIQTEDKTMEKFTAQTAIDYLNKKGVISSPEYWEKAAGVVKYLDELLINVAKKI